MEWLLVAAIALLPLLKFVLMPARTMGRGGGFTLVGAALLVAMMMGLFVLMQGLQDPAASLSPADQARAQADMKALERLLK